MWVTRNIEDFHFMFVCLDWNSRQTLEASPAAAEERIANGLTCTTVLTRVGNTRRYLNLTVPSGVLGATAAWEPWQTDKEEGDNKTDFIMNAEQSVHCSQFCLANTHTPLRNDMSTPTPTHNGTHNNLRSTVEMTTVGCNNFQDALLNSVCWH